MARGGSRGAPDDGSGGPFPKRGRPSASRGTPLSGDNPWRRAALALDRSRDEASDRLEALAAGVESRKRSDGKFVLGRVGAPRGVAGDLHIQSYSGESAHILRLATVDLVREGPVLPEIRLRLRVLRAEEGLGGPTLAFEGYPNRERALLLSGMEILAERGDAAPLGEGEWYVADLVGLDLVAPPGASGEAAGGEGYGRVLAVCEGGADPLLEVGLAGGGSALVPFRAEFIGDIDLKAGRIELLAPWILG